MAKLGDLKFELILDDKKFNQQITDNVRAAKSLNTDLSTLLDIKRQLGRLTNEEYQTQKRLDNIESNRRKNAEKELEAATRRKVQEEKLRREIEKGTKSMSQRGKVMRELTAMAGSYLSLMGAEKFVSAIVRTTGEFEKQRIALRAILKDVSGADSIFEQIKSLSVISPFRFKELVDYTKQLSAFSVPMSELYDTTKMLADVSAGLGVDMSRLVLAYGQVRSAAFLRGQEVRQFTESGIPILEELGKQIAEMEGHAVSAADVFDRISKRQVTFEMVAKVFKDMTSEGGKFYDMQATLADTLAGKISNLGDAFDIMFNSIGEKNLGFLKGTVSVITDLAKNYEKVGVVLISMASAYGIAKAGMIAYMLITEQLRWKQLALIKAFRLTRIWVLKNPYAALTAAAVAAVGAITALIVSYDRSNKMLRAVNDTVAEFNSQCDNERIKLDYIFGRMEKLTVGTGEYNDVKKELIQSYGQYLSNVDLENLKLGNLIPVYDKLIDKVTEYSRAKAMESGMARISDEYNQEAEEYYKWFNNNLKKILDPKKDEAIAKQLKDYFSGKVEWEDLTEEAIKVYRQFPMNRGFQYTMMGNELDVYREKLKKLQEDSKQATEDLVDMVNVLYTVDKPDGGNLNAWQKKIDDIVRGVKDLNVDDMKVDATDSVMDYVKKISELRDDLTKKALVEKGVDEELAKQEEERLKVIEKINTALGGAVDKYKETKKDGSPKGQGGKSKEEKELERRIKLLNTMKKIYDDFKGLGFADNTIRDILKGIPSLADQEGAEAYIQALKFDEELMKTASELAKYNPTSASTVLDSLGLGEGKDLAKEVKKAYEAIDKYYDAISEFMDKSYAKEGSGVAYDVEKIVTDYLNAANKVDIKMKEAQDLLKEALSGNRLAKEEIISKYGEEFWNDYVVNGKKALDQIAGYEKDALRKAAQERVDDLAQKYVKEQLFAANIDMTDLSDKSIFQLRKLMQNLQDEIDKNPLELNVETKEALEARGIDISNLAGTFDADGNLVKAGVNIDELAKSLEELSIPLTDDEKAILKMMQALQLANVSTESFGKTIKKVLQGKMSELSVEQWKKLAKTVSSYVDQLRNVTDALGELGKVTGNTGLSGLATQFSELAEVMGPVIESLMKGDWMSAVVSLVTSLATKAIQAATSVAQLKANIDSAAASQRVLNAEMDINKGVDNIFGTDSIKKLSNAYAKAEESFAAAKQRVSEVNKELSGGKGNNTPGWLAAIGTFTGIGLVSNLRTAIGLVDDYKVTLQDAADKLNLTLIDSTTGLYDVDALQTILNTYDSLDASSKKWLEDTIADTKIYANAIESLSDVMNNLLGDVAGDMASAFVDAFKTAGDAAMDYASIMDDVATQIGEAVIKSTLLENVFTDEQAKKAAEYLAKGDTAGALKIIDSAMQAAEELTPSIQKLLEGISGYMKVGESDTSSSGGTTLSSGIKSITEDTANLLASYVNAIRADVSYSKAQREQIIAGINQLLGGSQVSPSLDDYLNQISGYTYEISVSTREIMTDLRSVISPFDGGGYGINVNQ